MKATTEVRHLVHQRIDKYWADSILAETQSRDDPRWPWAVTLTGLNGQALNENWSDVWRWIVDWDAWAGSNGCTLTTSNRRVGGAIRSIPTRLIVPDLDTAAAIANSEWPRRLAAARTRAQTLVAEFPATTSGALLRNACALSDVDFELARAAADWFRRHDATGLTARQVPIAGLHAKWLEKNTRLVTGLSGRTELGLVTRPSRIQFSYLDDGWMRQGNRRRDSVTLDEPDQPPGYQPRIVVITENKDSALFFPPVERGIVIEGSGDAVIRLSQLPWVRACPTVIYWGDLDAHGFAILDRLRGTGIAAQSMLMDETTLHRYAAYASPTYADGRPLPIGRPAPTPFLSNDERRLLERITDPEWDGPRRIEQERIPLPAALDELARVASLLQ